MKIYQIHKYEEIEFEIDEDTIVASYINKDKAEREKLRLQQKNTELVAEIYKCKRCPYVADRNWGKTITQIEKENPDFQCENKSIMQASWGNACYNYKGNDNDISFKVIEEDVIE